MKTIHCIILLAALSACTAQPDDSAGRKTVYIDPSAAVQGNGSILSPLNTVSGIAYAAGTDYLLKRGTVLHETIDLSGVHASAGSPVRIGAYGLQSDPAPVIDGTAAPGTWSYNAPYYHATGITEAGAVIRNGVPMTFRAWNADASTSLAGAPDYSFTYDHSGSVIYLKSSTDPSADSVTIARNLYGIHGSGSSYVTITDISVTGAALHGIQFEDSDHISIEDCSVTACGGYYSTALSLYLGNGIEFGNSSSYCSVADTTVTDIFDSGVSPQTYASGHTASQFTFSGLTIERCGFAGIEIAALYNGGMTGSSISGVSVTGCEITDSGYGWSGRRYGIEGRGIKINADITATDATRSIAGVVISDTSVTGCAGEGIALSGKSGTVTARRMTIRGNGSNGILAQEIYATDLRLELYASVIAENGAGDTTHGITCNVPSGNGILLEHNTIYGNEFIGVNLWAHAGSVTLINNLFHSSAYGVHLLINAAFGTGDAALNNYFTEYGASQPVINYLGSVYDTAASFDAAYTFADSSAGGSDPLLDGSHMITSASSPCYHAGTSSAASTHDRAGNAYADPPSIGAFEYVP